MHANAQDIDHEVRDIASGRLHSNSLDRPRYGKELTAAGSPQSQSMIEHIQQISTQGMCYEAEVSVTFS